MHEAHASTSFVVQDDSIATPRLDESRTITVSPKACLLPQNLGKTDEKCVKLEPTNLKLKELFPKKMSSSGKKSFAEAHKAMNNVYGPS